ncbi:unnamed protein product [Amoebophrya sp. A120]|nr:unnamed protein product [Amoebophrya sp. A120]|eukprot:GSA120T00011717001.1
MSEENDKDQDPAEPEDPEEGSALKSGTNSALGDDDEEDENAGTTSDSGSGGGLLARLEAAAEAEEQAFQEEQAAEVETVETEETPPPPPLTPLQKFWKKVLPPKYAKRMGVPGIPDPPPVPPTEVELFQQRMDDLSQAYTDYGVGDPVRIFKCIPEDDAPDGYVTEYETETDEEPVAPGGANANVLQDGVAVVPAAPGEQITQGEGGAAGAPPVVVPPVNIASINGQQEGQQVDGAAAGGVQQEGGAALAEGSAVPAPPAGEGAAATRENTASLPASSPAPESAVASAAAASEPPVLASDKSPESSAERKEGTVSETQTQQGSSPQSQAAVPRADGQQPPGVPLPDGTVAGGEPPAAAGHQPETTGEAPQEGEPEPAEKKKRKRKVYYSQSGKKVQKHVVDGVPRYGRWVRGRVVEEHENTVLVAVGERRYDPQRSLKKYQKVADAKLRLMEKYSSYLRPRDETQSVKLRSIMNKGLRKKWVLAGRDFFTGEKKRFGEDEETVQEQAHKFRRMASQSLLEASASTLDVSKEVGKDAKSTGKSLTRSLTSALFPDKTPIHSIGIPEENERVYNKKNGKSSLAPEEGTVEYVLALSGLTTGEKDEIIHIIADSRVKIEPQLTAMWFDKEDCQFKYGDVGYTPDKWAREQTDGKKPIADYPLARLDPVPSLDSETAALAQIHEIHQDTGLRFSEEQKKEQYFDEKRMIWMARPKKVQAPPVEISKEYLVTTGKGNKPLYVVQGGVKAYIPNSERRLEALEG